MNSNFIKHFKEKFHFSHVAFFSMIFYVSKGIGLLPVSYDPKYKSRCPKGEPFKTSKIGFTLSVLQLVNHLWTVYNVIEFCIRTASEYKVTCMQGNHCVIYGVFITHAFVGLLNTFSAIYCHKNTIRCLNSLFRLLYIPKPAYSRFPTASFAIIGFIGLLALRLVVNKQLQPPNQLFPPFYYGYYISYFVPIVVLNIIATLALAAENAYRQVNHEMETLFYAKLDPVDFLHQIQRLADRHSKITDFMDEISSCFGFSLLLVMIDCFINFVLFLYLTIWNIFVENLFKGSLPPYITAMIEIATIVLKIVFLCYRCDKATYYGKLTMWHLHHLSTRPDLSPRCEQQINIFAMQYKVRPIQITALKLFPLNMDLLFKMMGIVSTYFIVLIQFQISNGKKKNTKLVNPKECTVWPCLGD